MDRLHPGQSLRVGQALVSGAYRFILQTDGNLVLYRGNGALWDSATVGRGATHAIMQTDGNFVLYAGRTPLWNSGTQGHPGAYVVMQTDGNVVVYQGTNPLWSTDTAGGVKHHHASLFESITHPIADLASQAAHIAQVPLHVAQGALNAITHNPVWDAVQTGVSFIPGIGTAVSVGMSIAAQLGKGGSAVDFALAAARGALPGGPPVQAAFDVAVGLLLHGQRLDNTAISLARDQVPGGELGKAAFDLAVSIILGKHASVQNLAMQAGQKLIPSSAPLLHAAYEAGAGLAKTAMPDPAVVQRVSSLFNDARTKSMFQAGMLSQKASQVTASQLAALKRNAMHNPLAHKVASAAHAAHHQIAHAVAQAHHVNAKALVRPILRKAMAVVVAAEQHNDPHARALIASIAAQAAHHNAAAQHTLNLLAVARGALRRGIHV